MYKTLSILVIASVAFTSHFIIKYLKKKKNPNENKIVDVKNDINEVIMFSPSNFDLKRSKYSRCAITTSMDRLLYYLNSPKHSIDICMYVMTNIDLTNIIIKLSYRNVLIRVILDADMAFSQGSALKRLQKQYIPVHWIKSTNLMHHKFCLIDTLSCNEQYTPLVITGSLNWTNQALNGNWEDVIVTSQNDIVKQYKDEFEKLWVQFKPIVDIPTSPSLLLRTRPCLTNNGR